MKFRYFVLVLFLSLFLFGCEAHQHNFVLEKIEIASCTEEGYKLYKCACGEEKIEHEDKLDHIFRESEVSPAACNKEGYKKQVCIVCGEEDVVTLDKLPHNSTSIEVSPTCIKEGSLTTYCRECNEIIEFKVLEKTNHNLEEVIIPSTCNVKGTSSMVCSFCKEVVSVSELGLSDHLERAYYKVKPTCLDSGERLIYCGSCGKDLRSETVDALGHDPVHHDEVSPTCVKDGMTDGETCSRCEMIISGMEVIDKLGHDEVVESCVTAYGHSYNHVTCRRCDLDYRRDLVVNYKNLIGYNHLLNDFDNGSRMAKFYEDIYNAAYEFTISDTTLVKLKDDEKYKGIKQFVIDCEYDGCVSHTSYGLTLPEAASVWNVMVHENPEFMFMYNGYSYGDSVHYHGLKSYSTKYFNLCISADYYDSDFRKQVFDGLNDQNILINKKMDMSKNVGEIARVIHDFIINSIDYSYIEGTSQANTDKWAHNLVGFALNLGGVCETYAKAYLYYSYLYEIDSIIVYGDNHAWNMTKYNDRYYGIDLTWDDKKDQPISYQYFGCNYSTFTDNGKKHNPYPAELGISYQMRVPEFGSTSWRVSAFGVILP